MDSGLGVVERHFVPCQVTTNGLFILFIFKITVSGQIKILLSILVFGTVCFGGDCRPL